MYLYQFHNHPVKFKKNSSILASNEVGCAALIAGGACCALVEALKSADKG
jgi:hypothetical protein